MERKVKEVRCPEDPRRLFTKLIQEGKRPSVVEGNLIEFACQNCKKSRQTQGLKVNRVLHRYNILGELVETFEDVV